MVRPSEHLLKEPSFTVPRRSALLSSELRRNLRGDRLGGHGLPDLPRPRLPREVRDPMEEVAGRGDPAVVRHEGTVWRPTGVVAGSERGSAGPDGGLPM